jgi:two-component system, cell cycle response regulator
MSSSPPGPKPRPTGAPRTIKASDHPNLRDEVMRRIKAPHRPVLVVLNGPDMGKRVVLDGSILIGRDPAAELVLSDTMISWHHARVEDRGDGWALFDLESTNGTTVNGEREREFLLQPNDRILLANTAVSFELQDALKEAYNENVERLLNIDDLSGLLVRRKFDTELSTLVEQARLQKQPLSLLVMDMDGIKRINDTHGHLFGAYVIGEAGHLIGRVIRDRGIGCRFGGDEYLAALPGFDAEAGREVANEILNAINRHAFVREDVTLVPGISIGIATFPEDATDPTALFQCADEALYRAKQAGKNRVMP